MILSISSLMKIIKRSMHWKSTSQPQQAIHCVIWFGATLSLFSLSVFWEWAFLGWFIYLKVVLPIRQISKAMRSGNTHPLTTLLHQKNEFAQIAQLINAFFIQKAQLYNSNQILEQKVEERTKELETINQTLDNRVKLEISRRHEQEQLFIQQARFAAMGEMIGNIAHQWRQPLNALSLLLQNVIFAYETGRLDRELIDRVNTKGNLLIRTMSTTIDDFRNFFKPNRNKERFNISEQLGKTLEILEGIA